MFWEKEEAAFNDAIKKYMKLAFKMRSEAQHKEHINTLLKQGNFLKLAENENVNVFWKSYIFDLKKGTMKFCLNAATNTLPTGDNLFMWGKSSTDKCKLCKERETTCHWNRGGTPGDITMSLITS